MGKIAMWGRLDNLSKSKKWKRDILTTGKNKMNFSEYFFLKSSFFERRNIGMRTWIKGLSTVLKANEFLK